MNFKDLAVLVNLHWKSYVLEIKNVDAKCENKKVRWEALIGCNLDELLESDSKEEKSSPTMVYVTFVANIDLQKVWNQNAVESYGMQVNRLTGEDNDFASEQICKLLNIDNKKLLEYAIYPFAFAKTQATVWGKRLVFCNDCAFEFE